MARKITIFPAHSDAPERAQLKRTTAITMVRRGDLDWIVKNVSARRRPIGEFKTAKLPIVRHHTPFIPTKLPPTEVSSIKFQRPTGSTTREERMNLLARARLFCGLPPRRHQIIHLA